jgi:hypothetical protein
MQQFDARAVMAARITQECRPEDLRRAPPAAAAAAQRSQAFSAGDALRGLPDPGRAHAASANS